jgi:MtN3 and saliva related transmembrane protein
MTTELIGWASSVVLLFTVSQQVYKQWQSGSSKGVSRWLFVGQVSASTGFVIYSWLLQNWVFVVTNALVGLNAMVGQVIVLHHRRKSKERPSRATPSSVEGACSPSQAEARSPIASSSSSLRSGS